MSLPAQYDELAKLARGINEHHDSARGLAAKSRDKLAEALAEVILAGQKLRMVKRILPHGQFLDWIKAHCPNISERTVQKYMRLINPNHGSDLESAEGIRQAYLLCGIVKADPRIGAESMQPIFRLPSLAGIAKAKPFEQWRADERELFKQWFDEHVAPLITLRNNIH